ncbi:hypothetical protein [Mycobacterium sp.]
MTPERAPDAPKAIVLTSKGLTPHALVQDFVFPGIEKIPFRQPTDHST